jgi:hypothetical protein
MSFAISRDTPAAIAAPGSIWKPGMDIRHKLKDADDDKNCAAGSSSPVRQDRVHSHVNHGRRRRRPRR